MNSEELFPIVDLDGNVIGKATRRECHSGSMLLHPVVHLHIVNRKGEIFLQKRSIDKDIQPGKWDTAVGGHVDYGEEVIDALKRETMEELGITIEHARHLLTYDFQSDREHELVNVYAISVDADNDFNPQFDRTEISEVKFWTIDEIMSAYGAGLLTPNFESEFKRIKDNLLSL